MFDAKTAADHQTIITRLLRRQHLPADVIDQIQINIDGAIIRTRHETTTHIINRISRIITVDQVSAALDALR